MLEGRTVLVTGGSGGIGAAIVKRLAAEGARPIIHYGSDKAGAESVLAGTGGKGLLVQADLSTVDGPFELWREAVKAAGRIHDLVNNAGVRTKIAVEDSPQEWRAVWQKEFQINFFAAADLCKEAIQHFRANGGGRIVNVSSRAGQRGYVADGLPYGTSKAALISLTKSIARSFAVDGVTAVGIAPGWVQTDMANDFIAAHGMQAAVADTPIGKMAAPSEIAELVAFVLRPSQASLNGATLDINGGSYIR
jgi:3-oxoacyl-[acyl-carrier protein] reductase